MNMPDEGSPHRRVMNVAFLSPINLERDGVGSPARGIVKYLSALCTLTHFPLDHEVHDRSHFRRMAAEINRCDLLHVEHTHPLFKVPFFPFREGFLDFIRRVKVPRLVVYHEPVESIPVYYPYGEDTLPSRARRTLLYAARLAARPFADAFWVPWHNRQIFSIPERVVVHSEYRAAMVRRYAPGARISVMAAPVYEPMERVPLEDTDFRVPFGRDDVVLTVFGFIDRRKDYVGVLEALLHLPPNHKLLVAGGCHDGNEYATPDSPYGRLMDFARRNGLGGRLHVTGFCPDWAIPGLMAASGLVVAPFTQHHNSGSINMGLAYSKPVVAYRTMLTEEMNRNGAGLFLIDGKGQLPGAIRDARAEGGRLEEAIRQGRGYCDRYGFPAQARQFARWYGELLASR